MVSVLLLLLVYIVCIGMHHILIGHHMFVLFMS